MQYVIGSIVALATLALAVGAITGRVKVRSCCAPANPTNDRRMRIDTYDVEPSSQRDPQNGEFRTTGADPVRQTEPPAGSIGS